MRDITLEDVKTSHYALKHLKELGMKLDFSEDKLFKIQCRKTGETIKCFESLTDVRMFIIGAQVQRERQGNV